MKFHSGLLIGRKLNKQNMKAKQASPTGALVSLARGRVRMVEYSPGYLADHFCSKGHIRLCPEGESHTELQDGRQFTVKSGMSYQVADDEELHRSFILRGAKLFIVD